MSRQKFLYIDYLRIITMLALVLYHCMCYYTHRWDYREVYITEYDYFCGRIVDWALPMFVFISGYLYHCIYMGGGYSDYLSYIKKKTLRLLIPWIVWTILFEAIVYQTPVSFSLFMLGGYKHLWFLLMLFWQFVIAPVYERVIHKLPIINVLWFAFLVIISWLFTHNPFRQLPFMVSTCITYCYAFYAGLYTSHLLPKLLKYGYLRVWGWIMLIFCILVYIAVPFVRLRWGTESILQSILLTCMMLCILILICRYNSNDYWLLLSLSKCSMGIYIFHHCILDVLFLFVPIRYCMNEHIWMPFLLYPLVLVLSWRITAVLIQSRYLSKLI